MNSSRTDRIEKCIELKAPLARVWKALTDHKEFGSWFRVVFEAPFVAGKISRGRLTYPGYENLIMEIVIQKMEPQHLFSFHWHPYAVDPKVDYSHEPPTLVEFKLQEIAGGTRLTVTESGFDSIPVARRDLAFRMNTNGWTQQVKNIETYVNDHP